MGEGDIHGIIKTNISFKLSIQNILEKSRK